MNGLEGFQIHPDLDGEIQGIVKNLLGVGLKNRAHFSWVPWVKCSGPLAWFVWVITPALSQTKLH